MRIDRDDVLVFAGLAVALVASWFAGGWTAVGILVGVVAVAAGTIRQIPRM